MRDKSHVSHPPKARQESRGKVDFPHPVMWKTPAIEPSVGKHLLWSVDREIFPNELAGDSPRKHRRLSQQARWDKLLDPIRRRRQKEALAFLTASMADEQAQKRPAPGEHEATIPQPGIHPKQGYRRIKLTPQQERGLDPVGTAHREWQEFQLRRRIRGTFTIPKSEFEDALAEYVTSEIEDMVVMRAKLQNPIEFFHLQPLRPITRPQSDIGTLERYLIRHRWASPRQISALLGRPHHAWLETVRNLQRKISAHGDELDYRIAWNIDGNLMVANIQSWEETDSSQILRFIIRPPNDVRNRYVRRVDHLAISQPPPPPEAA